MQCAMVLDTTSRGKFLAGMQHIPALQLTRLDFFPDSTNAVSILQYLCTQAPNRP